MDVRKLPRISTGIKVELCCRDDTYPYSIGYYVGFTEGNGQEDKRIYKLKEVLRSPLTDPFMVLATRCDDTIYDPSSLFYVSMEKITGCKTCVIDD